MLEILTDKKYIKIIEWHGTEGEFILLQPEEVAKLWGERKENPTMNYEKLARGLRYYYDGDMIGKTDIRFGYKFLCDLKELMGYSVKQLSDLVNGVQRQPRPRRYPGSISN